MEKTVKILKKTILIVLLIFPIFLISVSSELIIGDEIWNFQNIMKIVNGRQIYTDCNVIVTPIFYIIGKILVLAFGSNILGFRIYNVAIFFVLILSSFYIFRLLRIEKLKSCIYMFLIFIFIMPYISVGANYNVLAIALYLIRYNFIFK